MKQANGFLIRGAGPGNLKGTLFANGAWLRKWTIGGVLVAVLCAIAIWFGVPEPSKAKLYEITYQFFLITVVGGTVTALASMAKEKDARKKDGRDIIRSVAADLDAVYRDIKNQATHEGFACRKQLVRSGTAQSDQDGFVFWTDGGASGQANGN